MQKGVPVKWTISAAQSELNGCNNSINIPEYGIENKKLVAGENVIEFTPGEEGTFVYTCWMGIITSSIKVVSDINNVNPDNVKNKADNFTPPAGPEGSCCGQGQI